MHIEVPQIQQEVKLKQKKTWHQKHETKKPHTTGYFEPDLQLFSKVDKIQTREKQDEIKTGELKQAKYSHAL